MSILTWCSEFNPKPNTRGKLSGTNVLDCAFLLVDKYTHSLKWSRRRRRRRRKRKKRRSRRRKSRRRRRRRRRRKRSRKRRRRKRRRRNRRRKRSITETRTDKETNTLSQGWVEERRQEREKREQETCRRVVACLWEASSTSCTSEKLYIHCT